MPDETPRSPRAGTRSAKIVSLLRVSSTNESSGLIALADLAKDRELDCHAFFSDGGRVGIVCENPTETALALRDGGMVVDLETAVLVEAESHPSAIANLLRTVEAAGARVRWSYVVARPLTMILRTDDNPRAEDALRNYLGIEEGGSPPSSRS